MHVRKTLPVLFGVLVLAAGAAGQGTDGKVPSPTGGRPAEGAPPRGEPQNERVLQSIRGAVQPSAPQIERIQAQLGKLRTQQAEVRKQMMRTAQADRQGGKQEVDRTRIEAANAAAQKRIDDLNLRFLADCRSLLEPEQYQAWDALAPTLDLTPPRGERAARGGRGRPEGPRGPAEGAAAPDFELKDLRGKAVSLASLRGQPVVLEFGSYTCPVFRGKTREIETLRKEYGDTVTWVLVYTKEAHPSDESARPEPENAREGISVPQHASIDDRLKCAKECTEKMGLNVLVLVDGFDNKVTDLYAGWPNRGYVIDAHGSILSNQNWFDPKRTREVLDRLRRGDAVPPARK